MIYDFGVQEPYKTFLLNGQKTVEGRLDKGKFKKIKKGDMLQMEDGEKFLVVSKTKYKSFYQMIGTEGIENVLPDKTNILDGVNVYYKFYTKELEELYGVSAIKVQLIT